MVTSRKNSENTKKTTKAQRAAKRAPHSAASRRIAPSKPTPPEPAPTPPEQAPAPPPLFAPTSTASPPEPPAQAAPPEPAPPPTPAAAPPPPPPAPEPAPPPPAPEAPPPPPAPAAPPTAPTPDPPAQWVTVPGPAAAPTAPAAAQEDLELATATHRNGAPVLVALGSIVAIVGLLLLVYTYYSGYINGALPQPGGIRADYIGIVLLMAGLLAALVFAFVPRASTYALAGNATRDDLRREADHARAGLRTAQTLVTIGLVLVGLGLLWMTYWLFVAYRDGAMRNSLIGGLDVPTHGLGVLILTVGLLITMFFWGAVAGARRRYNLAIVALHRVPAEGAAAPTVPALPSGVTEQEIQNLIRRLDGLMAQLPDSAVTEFSKTPEADTYLKLLGS